MIALEKMLRIGRNSNSKLTCRFVNWFTRHYFGCDINCKTQIADSVRFPHNGLGVVINPHSIIEEGVTILPGAKLVVTKGATNAPYIQENVIIGANATIIGKIVIGKGAIIGAGGVCSKDVPNDYTLVGINKMYPTRRDTAEILHKNN